MAFGFRKRYHEQAEITPGTETPSGTPESEATGVETLDVLRRFEKTHHLDPNLPVHELHDVDAVLASGNAEKGVEIEQVLVEDNSPYPEVRSAVKNHDIDVPANTIRAWAIGLILCTVGSGVNMLFSLRAPGITITTLLVQLIAYPLGLLWDLVFPDHQFELLGLKFNLKPGRFNFKEHVVIVVMSNAAYGGGALYATDVIVAQRHFYGQKFDMLWQILFSMTTICIGYGLAGLARRFLVWPAAMIWPSTLVNASLFYTLHDHSPSDPADTNGWRVGRYRWFLIVTAGGFFWYWFPGWIFQGLTWFCWITWVWPESIIVNKLFGGYSGYGLMPITFDWSVISGYLLSPLVPPFHAIANTVAGILAIFVFASMGLHFSGYWYADYLPVQSSDAYDNTGQPYEFSFILDKTMHLDENQYSSYSPLYFSTQTALSYGVAFAAAAAVLVHVALYHGPDLWSQLREARRQDDDVHMRLMKKYGDARDWWYATLLVVTVGVSFAVVCAWPTDFPWWGLIVCLAIPLVWTVPIGIVQAITNIQLGLNQLTEYVVGYMLPGRPLAMMMFKNYGHLCMTQALYFAQDLKLGHYMKVPPRVVFWAQLIASLWSAVVQVLVMDWALAGGVPGVCEESPKNKYVCPGARSLYNSSVIWSAIGPQRLFGSGALYAPLQWLWLVGAVAPIITWLFARRYPRSLWRYVSMPVFFGGSGWIPPATVYMYLCWGVVGTAFNYFIKRRFSGWWMRYNYVTSAALDCGLAIGTIIVFFTLYMTQAAAIVWFGNAEALGTLDMTSRAIKSSLPRGATFGPASWP